MRVLAVVGLFFGLTQVVPAVSSAQPLSTRQLIEAGSEYDGKTVVFQGEVVGEIMKRRGGCWVNVNDGQDSIGVWMPWDMSEAIKFTGSYRFKGDIVRVKGVFHYSCPDHGGDLDLHADSLQVMQPGWQHKQNIIPAKRDLLILLTVLLCLTLILKILIVK